MRDEAFEPCRDEDHEECIAEGSPYDDGPMERCPCPCHMPGTVRFSAWNYDRPKK